MTCNVQLGRSALSTGSHAKATGWQCGVTGLQFGWGLFVNWIGVVQFGWGLSSNWNVVMQFGWGHLVTGLRCLGGVCLVTG